MITSKFVADFLTFSRLLLAAILGWLGWARGEGGLEMAAVIMIVSWFSDIIDGSLARMSRFTKRTWVGDHDLYFDMSVAVGLLIYLTASGYINTWLSVIYIFIWCLIFWRFGILSVLGKLFQTPVYAWFVFISFRFAPIYGGMIAVFLLLAVVITWPRFLTEMVPDFFGGFGELEEDSQDEFNDEHGINHPLNGNSRHSKLSQDEGNGTILD